MNFKHKLFFPIFTCCFLHLPAFAADPVFDEALVTWRDGQITRGDYEAALKQIPENDRAAFARDLKRITSLLENVLVNRRLAEQYRSLKLDQDPVLRKEVELATERTQALKRLEYFERNLKKPDFEAAAREKYLVNPGAYAEPDQVAASHILIATKKHSPEEARKLAAEVREKAVAGADFADLAKKYSEDPSAARNNGSLGLFSRGKMVKAFEDTAFAMNKPGQISDVIETQFGFHVLRLDEIRPGKKPSFEAVKDEIIKTLSQKYTEEERIAMISAVRSDSSIKLNNAAIDSLLVK